MRRNADVNLLLLAHLPTRVLEQGLIPAALDLDLQVTIVTDRAREHLSWAVEHRAARRCRVLACDVWNPLALTRLLEVHDLCPDGVLAADARLQACAALAADYLGRPGPSWRGALLCDQRARLRSRLEPHPCAPNRWIVGCSGREAAPAVDPAAFPVAVQPLEAEIGAAGPLARDEDELQRYLAEIADGHALVERHRPGEMYALDLLGTPDGIAVLGGHPIQLAADHRRSKHRQGFLARPPGAAEVVAQVEALALGLGRHQVEYVTTGQAIRIMEIHNGLHDGESELALDARLGGAVFRATLQVCLGRPVPALFRARRGEAPGRSEDATAADQPRAAATAIG
jgi:hypothetical protein